VIDTSASVAILFGEPEAATFAEILEQDLVRLISAASVLEAAIVVESEFGHRGARERDHLLYQAGITSAVLTRALGPRPAMPFGPSASIGKPPP
jgi:ribonuclease VapC